MYCTFHTPQLSPASLLVLAFILLELHIQITNDYQVWIFCSHQQSSTCLSGTWQLLQKIIRIDMGKWWMGNGYILVALLCAHLNSQRGEPMISYQWQEWIDQCWTRKQHLDQGWWQSHSIEERHQWKERGMWVIERRIRTCKAQKSLIAHNEPLQNQVEGYGEVTLCLADW